MEVQSGIQIQKEKSSNFRAERLLVEGDLVKYTGNGRGIGVYVSQDALVNEDNYFELTILNTDMFGAVSIGVCHMAFPLNKMPGWDKDSLGYHGDDGMLYRGNVLRYRFGPRCGRGDRMGCGVRAPLLSLHDQEQLERRPPDQTHRVHYVFFTRNGKEVGCETIVMPQGGLYPCVGLAGPQDVVRLARPVPPPSPPLSAPTVLSPYSPVSSVPREDAPMAVDFKEEDWSRLHDVKLNGQCVSYSGRGKRVRDIGLAVAKLPLSPASHYFQLQILDPGKHAYITIGITKKKYPLRCHPGWRSGSVAYHADDGRVFRGGRSVRGTHFGPPCGRGDVMGCGILFPRDYSHNNYVNSSGDESDNESAETTSFCSDDDYDLDDEDDNDEEEEEEEDEYDDYIAASAAELLPQQQHIVVSDAGIELPYSPQTMLNKLLELDAVETSKVFASLGGVEREGEDLLEGEALVRHQRILLLPPRQQQSRNTNRKRKNNGVASSGGGGDRRRSAGGGGGGGGSRNKDDKSSNGFINRNSLLIKDLRPPQRAPGVQEGEPVVQVFFTRNGCLLGRVEAVVPKGGFFPTISLGGPQERVRVDLQPLSG